MKLFSNEKSLHQNEEAILRINAFKKKVDERVNELNHEVMRLNYISGSTNTSIKAVKSSILDINDGNDTLARHIEEVGRISSSMENDIEENAQHMHELVQIMDTMTKSNRRLFEIFGKLLEENQCTSEQIEEISRHTDEVNIETKNILKIITTINTIAQKTNMLSLNASIEAERVGEAGKGFSVVATQIGSLADLSRKSAKNIGDTVIKLGKQAEISVDNIEKIKDIYRGQTESILQTKALLEETGRKIEEVQKYVKAVDEKLERLTISKNTIHESMEDLIKLGDTNLEATKMIGNDFEKLISHLGNVGNVAYRLTDISESFKEYTGKYDSGSERGAVIVKIGYMPNYGSLSSLACSMKLGYMEREGIRPELMEFPNGMEIIDALKKGRIDIGYIGDGAHKRCINGEAVIFLLSHISNAEAVYGSRKQGVRNLMALKNKRIGTITGSTSDTILDYALESVGINRSECDIRNGSSESIIQDMTEGRLDACALWSPNTLELEKRMGNQAVLLANNLKFSHKMASLSSWITTKKFAVENEKLLLKITRALYCGMDYRALEMHTKNIASWIADMTGLLEENLYQQKNDADWLGRGYVALGAEDGTVEGLYLAQQNHLLKMGVIQSKVPVSSYVLLENMKRAARE